MTQELEMFNIQTSGRHIYIFNWVIVGDNGKDAAAVEGSLNDEAVGVFGGVMVVEGNEARVSDEGVPVFGEGFESEEGFHGKAR